MTKKNVLLSVLATVIILLTIASVIRGSISTFFNRADQATQNNASTGKEQEVIADNLDVPWGLAFLPSGDMLVTERPGTLKRIGENRQSHVIQGVAHTSEGGLLGIELHPQFAQNQWLYLYLTTKDEKGLSNRIERYTYQNDQLSDRRVILEGIPGSNNHDGGRIAFGPDGNLYVTTGDAGDSSAAQDKQSLAGKILRTTADGKTPAGNPFNNAVYSYGHRNPQGIAPLPLT